MNWIYRFQQILGHFWSDVFSELDFTLGVKKLHAFFSNKKQQRLDQWTSGNVMADNNKYDVAMPYVIYLSKMKTYKDEHGDYGSISTVVKPACSFDDILDGYAGLDDREEHGGWVVQSRFDIMVPHHMTDHVVDYNKTMFNGVDYEWKDGAFLFHFDPALLKLPEVCVQESDGSLHVYWKLFGWCTPEEAMKDAVAAFDSQKLNPYAETVWDIHQNGADYYNSKQLLGKVTGSVICKEDGAVDAIWIEQEERCMMVGKHVYHAPVTVQCNYQRGDNVYKGDVLFGTLRMFSSKDMPDNVSASDIPGMKVMTNVGALVAENKNENAVVGYNGNILPLKSNYSASVSTDYIAMCNANQRNPNCAKVDVPAVVNPFKFIFKTLRRGSGIFASMTVDTGMAIAEALGCIRKSINASGMMTVYLQAEGDIVGVTESKFTAKAGNAAVAVDATVTVIKMFADAEIVL